MIVSQGLGHTGSAVRNRLTTTPSLHCCPYQGYASSVCVMSPTFQPFNKLCDRHYAIYIHQMIRGNTAITNRLGQAESWQVCTSFSASCNSLHFLTYLSQWQQRHLSHQQSMCLPKQETLAERSYSDRQSLSFYYIIVITAIFIVCDKRGSQRTA